MAIVNGRWWYDPPPNPTCVCGHPKMHHWYLMIIGDNVGPCLIKKNGKCECKMFEEAE